MVTVQVSAVEHPVAPVQLVKVDPAAGVAVNVTTVPWLKLAVQAVLPLPQEMPDGLLATDPVPFPAVLSVSANV
jgi:hypothetical protein